MAKLIKRFFPSGRIGGSLLLALASLTANAQEAPLWLRDVRISPDGQNIAFCYKGDIYKVAVAGGQAQRLTTQASYESNLVWSPDGKTIAFASDRNGNFDVFVMPADGGAAKRLTYNSASELPTAFTPDGANVLFTSCIQDPAESAMFPYRPLTELYKVSVSGGRTLQVLATPAEAVMFSKDGKTMYYQDRKGSEDEWRKHHTSSVTRDVWAYDIATKKHTNLTARAGEDRNPVLSPDGKTMFILSERNGGTFNVYRFPVGNASQAEKVTDFKTHPVRFLSMSNSGTLCYTYDGEIYTQSMTGTPSKVKISVLRDDESNIADLRFTSGATSGTVSRDGKQIAFVQRGEVFVTATDYATTKQITKTVEAEQGVCFAPDSRTLAYASERNGIWQIFEAKIARKEDPNFPNATLINERLLTPDDGIERSYPQYSPDGKEIAYIEGRRKLMVMNLKTKAVRQVTDGSTWMETNGGFDYEWSPDGKWFTLEFIGNRRDPYSDIGIVSSQGGKIINITESGYSSGNPRWVLDGNAILFANERYGMRNHASWGSEDDAFLVFLNKDSYDKFSLSEEDYKLLKELEKEQKATAASASQSSAKNNSKKPAKNTAKKDEKKDDKGGAEKKDGESSAKPAAKKDIAVELDGIQQRIVRLTPASSHMGSCILSKDGESLYYFASFEGKYDLWKISLRKKETKLLNKMNTSGAHLEMDKDGNIFILGSESSKKMDGKSEKIEPITYSARMKQDLAKERKYMFDHVYRQEKERFYNLNMHGIDWDKMHEEYAKFLPHIDNNYDFQELLSEMLGELNVSHTGGRYYRPSQPTDDVTAQLGLLYDMTYAGDGIKVTEVVKGGPFDRADSKVKAGCLLEKIDGVALTADMDLSQLTNNLGRRKVLVSFRDAKTGKQWDEVIKPITTSIMSDLMYNRWVKRCAHWVDSLSNGRLGYVHLESMNDASFRNAYSDMLGKYNMREGVIIDTRYNGGGRLHEDIEILVSGQKYLTQVIRGVEACDMPSRRWNKPTVMLTSEANYSNAHGTPWVYQHQKLGKVIGAPVPGTMTSVSWERLQDNTLVFGIPIIGYLTAEGNYLENTQLEPDIHVLNLHESVVKGEDLQLKRAVEELLKK